MQEIAGWIGLVFEHMAIFVVLGVGLQLVCCYVIQAIADKENVSHSWMAWIPLLQLYPVISAGGSFTVFLSMMAAGVVSVIASALLGPVGVWLTGFIPPHKAGLLLGFVCIVLPAVPQLRAARELAKLGPQLPAMVAAAENDDQQAMLHLMRQWFETMEDMENLDATEEDRKAMSKAFDELTASMEAEPESADDDESESRPPDPPASDYSTSKEKADLRAVSEWFGCPSGTNERGARLPQAYERWCDRMDPVRGAVRHGGYASWHRNGQLHRVGIFEDGRRQGVWTRWGAEGIKQAQAEYEDGLQHGFQLTWDETGHYYHQIRFDRGEPVAG